MKKWISLFVLLMLLTFACDNGNSGDEVISYSEVTEDIRRNYALADFFITAAMDYAFNKEGTNTEGWTTTVSGDTDLDLQALKATGEDFHYYIIVTTTFDNFILDSLTLNGTAQRVLKFSYDKSQIEGTMILETSGSLNISIDDTAMRFRLATQQIQIGNGVEEPATTYNGNVIVDGNFYRYDELMNYELNE